MDAKVAVLVVGLVMVGAGHALLNVAVRAVISDCVPPPQIGTAFAVVTFFMQAGLVLGYASAKASWGQSGYFAGLTSHACTAQGLCLDLRVAMLFAALLLILSGLLVVLSSPDPEVTGQPASACCGLWVLSEEVNEVQAVLEVADMRAALMSSTLAWAGWWTFQVFLTHFVATELFGGTEEIGSPRHMRYKEGLHFASGGLLLCACLGWPVALLIPKLLEYIGGFSLWLASDLLFASLLLGGFLVREYPHRTLAFAWLSSFGAFYIVQTTLPFALITRLAQDRGVSRGASIALVSISSHLAQIAVALFGGFLNNLVSSDMASFAVGALCSVWAGVIISYLLMRDCDFEKGADVRVVAPAATALE